MRFVVWVNTSRFVMCSWAPRELGLIAAAQDYIDENQMVPTMSQGKRRR